MKRNIFIFLGLAFILSAPIAAHSYIVPGPDSSGIYTWNIGADLSKDTIANFQFSIANYSDLNSIALSVAFNSIDFKGNKVQFRLLDGDSNAITLDGAFNPSQTPFTFNLMGTNWQNFVGDDGIFNLEIKNISDNNKTVHVNSVTGAVPIPGAAWLLGTGLIGLVTIQRRIRK